MKKLSVAFVILGVGVAAFTFGRATAGKAKKQFDLPSADMKWDEVFPGTPNGPMISTVQGNRNKGAHISLMKLPAGMVSPQHTHTQDVNGIVLSGTVMHWMDG